LGCSAFGSEFFDLIERFANTPKTQEACVVFSGRPDKGYMDAVHYCKKRGISPVVIKDLSPSDALRVLAQARRLVLLPRWYEAASRLAVEAFLLNCELVTNDKVSVKEEPWWSWPREDAEAFVKATPNRFWDIVDGMLA